MFFFNKPHKAKFANGGKVQFNKKHAESVFLDYASLNNYLGEYDLEEDDILQLEWGKYGYGVSQSQQSIDYNLLQNAAKKFNTDNLGVMYAFVEYSDKFNSVKIISYDAISKRNSYTEKLFEENKKAFDVLTKKYKTDLVNNFVKQKQTEQNTQNKTKNEIEKYSKQCGFEISNALYEFLKGLKNPRFSMRYGYKVAFAGKYNKQFDNANDLLEYIQTKDFANVLYSDETKFTIYFDKDYMSVQYQKYSNSIIFGYGYLVSEIQPSQTKESVYLQLMEKFVCAYKLILLDGNKFANGGKITWDMNWHSFTISQLKQWMNQHNYHDITVELTTEKTHHSYNYKKDDYKNLYFDKSLDLRSGEENLYFDILVTDDNNKEWIVSFFTKDNKFGLKKIAKSLIDKFANGGKVKGDNELIKEWYVKTYPSDELGAEIPDNITFKQMFDDIMAKEDIYHMYVSDSVIRERMFEKLSEIYNVDYNIIYKRWLAAVDYAKGGKISRAKKQYNKEVDAYKWFIVNLETQKAESGWEYKQDAIDALSDFDDNKNYKVVAEVTLNKMGIENPKEKWKNNTYDKGGKVLSNKEIIGEIDFDDNTDIRHGYYTFSFETTDAEGADMFDYSGSIQEAPANSRRDDEVEWDLNTPEDWETAEEYVIQKFYEWKNKKYENGGSVSSFANKNIGKKVKVDFRKEEGIIVGSEGDYVSIEYPSLGFTEKVNPNLVDITFIDDVYDNGGEIKSPKLTNLTIHDWLKDYCRWGNLKIDEEYNPELRYKGYNGNHFINAKINGIVIPQKLMQSDFGFTLEEEWKWLINHKGELADKKEFTQALANWKMGVKHLMINRWGLMSEYSSGLYGTTWGRTEKFLDTTKDEAKQIYNAVQDMKSWDEFTFDVKNNVYADGGEVSFDEINNQPKEKKVNVFDKSVNYDTRKMLNRGTEKIESELVNKIENRGITIEELEALDVPIFKYKTQITIHGIFDGDFNTRVGGYKSLIHNQNKSLGVRYVAIDAGKKRTIEDALTYMRLVGEKPKWSVSKDSTGFALYHVQPVTKENIEQVKNEMKILFDAIPDTFIGDKYAYFQRTLWGGIQAVIMIQINAIYEKNLYKLIDFVTNGYIKSATDLKTLIDKYTEKEKAKREAEQAERNQAAKEENEKVKELYLPKKEKLAAESPFNILTELPDVSYFNTHDTFRYALITRNTESEGSFNKTKGYDAVIEVREIIKKRQWFYEQKYNEVQTWDETTGKLEEQSRYGKLPTVDYETLKRRIVAGVEKGLLYYNLQSKKNTQPKTITEEPKTIKTTEPKQVNTDVSNIDLRLVNYSDKSVAVFGASTYQFRKSLANVGGSFNKFIVNPDTKMREAGWIYPIKHKAELEKLIFDAKQGILKYDEGGYVARVPRKGERIVFSSNGINAYEGKVLGVGEKETGVDSGIKVNFMLNSFAIIFRTDVQCILTREDNVVCRAEMDTPDGKIGSLIQWNNYWQKLQLYIDGSLYGEYANMQEAIMDMEKSGFKNIDYY